VSIHSRRPRRAAPSRWPGRVAFVALVPALALLPRVQADAGGYQTIDGSGSSWASVALFQWAKDVQSRGLTINYNPNGSALGRQNYLQGGQVDFAGSDPPFRNGKDQLGGTSAEPHPWGYSYVPDTAGGTAFMYHITVAGHLVRNLRLDPKTLFEIFTGTIRNWDDPRITHIYGAKLPNEPIIPVLRADGSGATYFLTRWFSHLFPSQWNAFCKRVRSGIHDPCGPTEFYPSFGNSKSENGSIAVTDYITAPFGEGSIGYDEYAYALGKNYPVVQLLNPDNYFVGPTASNVAVALTKAQINLNSRSQDFLQQNLDSVYRFKDPRSYPLSSYSYLIVPRSGTKTPPFFTNGSPGAGRSLSTFINYYLCAGQKQMAPLGYSPLPFNLVKGAFLQVTRISNHVNPPNIAHYSSCGNPTFRNGKNILLLNAPYPSKCQKLGAPLDCAVRNGKAVPAGSGSGSGSGSGGAGSGSGSGSGAGSGSGSGRGGTGSGAFNPATGAGSGTTGPTAGVANATGSVVNLGSNGTVRALLAVLTALGIVGAVAAPPAVSAWLRRRRQA
jgi:ABC-type phosphate transport system substrate-binding protein